MEKWIGSEDQVQEPLFVWKLGVQRTNNSEVERTNTICKQSIAMARRTVDTRVCKDVCVCVFKQVWVCVCVLRVVCVYVLRVVVCECSGRFRVCVESCVWYVCLSVC